MGEGEEFLATEGTAVCKARKGKIKKENTFATWVFSMPAARKTVSGPRGNSGSGRIGKKFRELRRKE